MNIWIFEYFYMFRIDHIGILQIFQGILYKYRLFVVLSKNCARDVPSIKGIVTHLRLLILSDKNGFEIENYEKLD